MGEPQDPAALWRTLMTGVSGRAMVFGQGCILLGMYTHMQRFARPDERRIVTGAFSAFSSTSPVRAASLPSIRARVIDK